MGLNVREDLERSENIILDISANVRELYKAIDHLEGKKKYYRKILDGEHKFDITAMNNEIAAATVEIKKIERTITAERKRMDHHRKIVETLNGLQK